VIENHPLANLGENGPFLPFTDYLNGPRIFQDTVDIGAIEGLRIRDSLNTSLVGSTSTEFRLYPNPVRKNISLKVRPEPTANAKLHLIDLQGRTLWQKGVEEEISLDGVASGWYFLVLMDRGKRNSRLILVEND